MQRQTAKKEAWRPKCAAPRLVYGSALFLDTFIHVYVRTIRTTKYIRRNKKKEIPGGQVLGWTCRTCVQNFRVYLLKTAWVFGVLCGKYVYCSICLQILGFSVGSSLCVIFHLLFNTGGSDLRMFCVKLFTGEPWSTCSRIVQKKNEEKMFCLQKRLTILGFLGGLWSVGTRFRH